MDLLDAYTVHSRLNCYSSQVSCCKDLSLNKRVGTISDSIDDLTVDSTRQKDNNGPTFYSD